MSNDPVYLVKDPIVFVLHFPKLLDLFGQSTILSTLDPEDLLQPLPRGHLESPEEVAVGVQGGNLTIRGHFLSAQGKTL